MKFPWCVFSPVSISDTCRYLLFNLSIYKHFILKKVLEWYLLLLFSYRLSNKGCKENRNCLNRNYILLFVPRFHKIRKFKIFSMCVSPVSISDARWYFSLHLWIYKLLFEEREGEVCNYYCYFVIDCLIGDVRKIRTVQIGIMLFFFLTYAFFDYQSCLHPWRDN